MSYMSKFVTASTGLVLMTGISIWQLYLYAGLIDISGSGIRTDKTHLWLGAIAVVTSCFALGLTSYFFGRRNTKWATVEMTAAGPPASSLNMNSLKSQKPVVFDALRWGLANQWLVSGQASDRSPMDGSVANSGEPSGQRSLARRSHQLMFKKWSQARHD